MKNTYDVPDDEAEEILLLVGDSNDTTQSKLGLEELVALQFVYVLLSLILNVPINEHLSKHL